MDTDQARLLQLAGLDLPKSFGLELSVSDQREAVGVLSIATGKALCGIYHAAQIFTLGKFSVLGCYSLGDLLKLAMVGEFMVDNCEEIVEFSHLYTSMHYRYVNAGSLWRDAMF